MESRPTRKESLVPFITMLQLPMLRKSDTGPTAKEKYSSVPVPFLQTTNYDFESGKWYIFSGRLKGIIFHYILLL